MAGFFDKVAEGVNKGISSVSEGSKVVVEKVNLNTKIKDSEKERNNLIQNLGALVYNLHISGEIEVEQCLGLCNEITAKGQQIQAFQQQLQALDAVKTQPQQYAQQPGNNGDVFGNGIPCSCGHINNIGSRFCAKCGKQV